ATRVENACATGSAAIHMGLNAIAAGKARIVLVVGVEKMTEVSGAVVNDLLLRASYRKEEDQIEGGFAGIFGQIAQKYFQRYGDQSDALARIAAKNHKNGVANPMAQMRRDLGYEFCPTVSDKKPLAASRLTLDDLDLVETHDCFTIAELIEYEAMGLAPKGEGARAILEGWTEKDGRLPINPSGGLKSKGHPVGATGVSMHVLASMQVTGQAGDMQIPNAALAGIMNMGGAAVANFISILEPLRT